MALKGSQGEAALPKPVAAQIAPLQVAGVFLLGFVFLYLGRNSDVSGSWSTALTALAVALTVGATAVRWLPRYKGAAGEASIAKLLIGVQGLGLVGVALSFANVDVVTVRLDEGSHLPTVLSVMAVIAIAVSTLSLALAELALQPMRGAARVEVPRVAAAAATGAILAAAGAYGALFVYAAAQTASQADFSYFKTSEPSEATVKLVRSMATPLEVVGFFPEVNQVRKEVKGYLTKLKERSGNVEFRLLDRYLEPKMAADLKVTFDGTLVLKHGESNRTLFIGAEIDQVRSQLIKLDKDFYNRASQLAREELVAYWTVGHGELNDNPQGLRKAEGRSGDLMRELLEQQNYRVKDLGLNEGLSTEVPKDADLVLVLGPSEPFGPEEIDTLQRYADGGGKLFMALDVDSVLEGYRNEGGSLLPVAGVASGGAASGGVAGGGAAAQDAPAADAPFAWLVRLASIVGAKFEAAILADETKHAVRRRNTSDRVLLHTNRFSSHASVSTLSRNSTRAGVLAFGASYFLDNKEPPYSTDVTVRSYESAFVDKNRNFERDGDEASADHYLGLAVTKPIVNSTASDPAAAPAAAAGGAAAGKDGGPKAPEMRAFAFADADAFSDLVLSNSMNNRLLAFDAIRWLAGEESLAGEMESEEDVKVETTKGTDTVWFYLTIFGMPTLVLGCGLFVSRRAKKTTRKAAGAR